MHGAMPPNPEWTKHHHAEAMTGTMPPSPEWTKHHHAEAINGTMPPIPEWTLPCTLPRHLHLLT